MKTLLLSLALLITKLLFANTAITEGEPSAIVQGVHVITGDLYLKEEDVVIQGVEPIRLQRTYISNRGKGYWQFLNSHVAFMKSGVLEITEQSGAKLYYRHRVQYGRKKQSHTFELLNLSEDAKGVTNTSKGILSGNTNLKNQRIEMRPDEKEFTVHCPNGNRKTYRKTYEFALKNFFDLELTDLEKYTYTYVLIKECLANGNHILYKWPKKKDEVWEIRSCDASEKEIYAWARFYPKNGKDKRSYGDYGIETSDGRHFEHYYFTHHNFYQLKKAESNENPSQTYHYSSHGKRNLLNRIVLPQGRNSHILYYMPGENGIQEKAPLCYRVKEIKAPLGQDNQEISSHRFIYDLDQKKTIVLDAYDVPTDYYWNDDLRLIRIDRFLRPGVPYNREKFIWGDNSTENASNLLCKILFNEQDKAISATRYFYDSYGNVKEERFYGNLSGYQNAFFELDEKGFPKENTECYIKKFEHSTDGKNLLKKREEDNGLSVSYSYYKNTPLLEEETHFDHGVPKKRKRYIYNEKKILIQEISEDCEGSTYLNTHFILKNSPPYLGFPEVIEEREGRSEKLLRKTKLLYEHGGRIQKKEIFDATNNFKYERRYFFEKGNLVKEINPKGAVATSKYDDMKNKWFYQDFDSTSTLTIEYDYSNRPYSYQETDGTLTQRYDSSFSYLHTKKESFDFYSNKTTYEHDPFGHLIETRLPNGSLIRSIYNAQGNETLHIDAKGNQTETTYSAYGKPLHISYPDHTTEQFYYKKDGSLEKHIDQMGFETHYTHDVFGRLLSKENSLSKETRTYSGMQILSLTDPEGYVTTFEYDEAGRKIKETLLGETILYTYDSLGRLHTLQNGDLKVIKEYDFLDNLIYEKKENLQGEILEEISNQYDNAGKLRSSTKYIDGRSVMSEFFYDAFSRPIKKTDGLGHATIYTYDPHSNKKTTTDPLGLQITENFDFEDKLVHSETRSPNGDLVLRKTYFYDLNQNLEKIESASADFVTHTLQEYDSLNRLITLTEGAYSSFQKITSYTYDPRGFPDQIIKPSGTILSHTFDSSGNLIHLTSSDETIDYTYQYNKNGLPLQSINHITKEILLQTYDHRGRLLSEKLPSGLSFQNTYDNQGRRQTFNLPDHSSIYYTYNGSQLRSISKIQNAKILYTHQYLSYDRSSNVLEEETIFGTRTSHHYDNLNRHHEIHSPYFTSKDCLFDSAGNLLQMRRQKELLTYKYDSLSQLTEESGHTYQYDAHQNRLCKDDHFSTVNELNQTSDLIYNLDGNPTSWQDKTLIYDALDRLIEVLEPFKKTCYTYDSFHRRLSKKTYKLHQNTWQLFDTLYFLYDGQNEIGSANDQLEILELRILGNGSAEIGAAIALELYGQLYLPIHDLQGNVATLISSSSLEEYSYSAFGEELFLAPPSLNPWRFSSKRLDPETNFVYYGRRYYLPELGRWLTPDPLGLEAGPNFYTFVLNSPLTHLDLYGLFEMLIGPPSFLTDYHTLNVQDLNAPQSTVRRETYTFTQTVGSIEVPHTKFYFINGILNSPSKAEKSTALCSQYGGGIKIQNFYAPMEFNPSGISDICLSFATVKTSPVDLIIQECLKFHFSRPKKDKMFWICHSNGASLMYNALKRLPDFIQKRCIVLAIAPATVVPNELCFYSKNYASKRDFVPLIKPGLSFLKPTFPSLICDLMKIPPSSYSHFNELTFLNPHQDSDTFDHGAHSPTFEKPITDDIGNYIKQQGVSCSTLYR